MLAALDIDAIRQQLNVAHIPPKIAGSTADAALALSQWFTSSHKMALQAPKLVESFRAQRLAMAQVPAATFDNLINMVSQRRVALIDPWRTLQRFAKGWDYKRHALNPYVTADEVYAVKIDILILRLINFMVTEGGKIFLAAHPQQSESFVRAANRLQEFATDMSMQDLRALIPTTGTIPSVSEDRHDTICNALRECFNGGATDFQSLQEALLAEEHVEPGAFLINPCPYK